MGKSWRLATAVSAMSCLVLLFGVEQATAASLRVSIKPTAKVKLNQRSCFEGRVTLGRRGVVAEVDLEGKNVKSNRRGAYRLCQTIHWTGAHAVYAFKGGRTAHDKFRVGTTGMTSGVNWKRFEIQLPAYPQAPMPGSCAPGAIPGPVEFGINYGVCIGWSNPGTDGQFSGKRLMVEWQGKPTPTDLRFMYRGDYCPCIYGWVDGPGARIFHPTGGDPGLEEQGGFKFGSDPDKPGQPGGTWLLKTTPHEDALGLYQNGWTIHTIGYLYETRS
ncbi:MAG TPA: hypothetical protein VMF31_12770 [Solirubrobacterales bacterium]|nr:hypothetical protein [Solirubrobacterales bacterium]